MAAVGGSVEEISLAGRSFPVTADADVNRKLGGTENDVQANGNSTARIIKTAVVPMLTGIVVECDDVQNDHQFLQQIADGNEFVAMTITYASGVVYQGRATISSELQYSSQNATASFDLMGEGVFTKQ
jgi:hypothetical protein